MAAPKESLDQFWHDFQSALRRNDVSEVARLTRFPLDVSLSRLQEFEGIEHREGFVRHFKDLFPKEAVRTLLETSRHSIELGPSPEGQAVECWSISHAEPHEISEMEWGIIYTFSKFADGSFRLTAIHFAG